MCKITSASVIIGILFLIGLPAQGSEDADLKAAFERLPAAEKQFQAGKAEFLEGRYREAAAAFEKCVEKLPLHAFARYYLANIAYIQGDPETALTHMERSLADLPFMHELNAYAAKRKSRSFDSYRQMLDTAWAAAEGAAGGSCRPRREIESLNAELDTEKSKLELEAERERAQRNLQSAHYRFFLGNIHLQLKHLADALRLYREALALDPRHASAYNNAAAVLYMSGDFPGALDLLETAEREGLGDFLNLKLEHLVLEALGRPTEGVLREDLSRGPEADLGVERFALATKSWNPLLPPLYENCYVVFSRSTRQAVVIDPGAEDPRIADFVAGNGLEVKAVLNTHGHPDHTAANAHFSALFKAEVIAPKQDAADLPVPPARSVDDGAVLRFDGLTLEVLHTPGHSPGSSCFLVGDFLFSGDTLFKGSIGRTQDKGPEKAGEAQRRLVRTIREKLLALPGQTLVCPGHGKTSTIADETADNPFLKK